MIGWLLNLAYALLLTAASPILVWRAVMQGKYRRGGREKLFGLLPETAEGEQVIWLHAVSVGEVLQLRTIIPRLHSDRPQQTVLITTTTFTGHAVARESFPNCRIAYWPLDFTWAVKVALRRVRPVLVGLVELELWPNFIRETAAAGIPLMLINGRLSERSHRGYRRLRFLVQPLLSRFQALAVQTDEYASRLTDLGAPSNRLTVTGSVKFDGVQVDRHSEQTAELRSAFSITGGDIVLIAGSTHEPEETVALDAWQELQQELPNLRLILVPRHRERFDAVASVVESRGLPLIRRSQRKTSTNAEGTSNSLRYSIGLLDTLGELSACWGLADVAFVGGSLTRRGGQNMIEPAAYGVPVIVGPNTWNFRDVVDGLRSVGGIRSINRGADLATAVRDLLTDPVAAAKQGAAARAFVLAQQGAAGRTLEIMGQLPPPKTLRQPRQAA